MSCVDDPLWHDTNFGGDGNATCVNKDPKQSVASNLDWCSILQYGAYAIEARRACPRSCHACGAGTTRPHTRTRTRLVLSVRR